VDGNRVEEAGGGGWQECITVAGTDTFEVRNGDGIADYDIGAYETPFYAKWVYLPLIL
jgi:hypothetical protein